LHRHACARSSTENDRAPALEFVDFAGAVEDLRVMRGHGIRLFTLCAIAAACFGLDGSAHGKTLNKAAAREAYQRGIEHYNLNEFTPALEAFREAYRNYNDASFLFNIGQCQRQLGDKQNAILSYKAYLRESPNAPNRPEVQQMIVTLESALHDEQRPAPAPAKVEPAPEAKPAPALVAPAVTATAPTPVPERTPIYKRWWLWTAVGVVAVGGLAVGLGIGLTRGTSYPSATTSNGTFAF
jgi:tetratricopeptide (TPR) repeat protein